MKKSLIIIAAIAALVSCRALKEEWTPVLSPAKEPGLEDVQNLDARVNCTIAELKAMYTKSKEPVHLYDNIWIKGQVISSDRTGNIYRELYIQDESGVIDVKVGRSAMYADYPLGQWMYIYCTGLTLGEYDGTLQLGVDKDLQGPNSEYEVAYIDVQYIIDQHVFKGPKGEPVKAIEVTADRIKQAVSKGKQDPIWGRYVIVKDLYYGCNKGGYTNVNKKVFFFIYVDPNAKDKKVSTNRFFFSDGTYSINTWAMSKEKFRWYLQNGYLDKGHIEGDLDRADDPLTEGITERLNAYIKEQKDMGYTVSLDEQEEFRKDVRKQIYDNASAQSLSQYFLMSSNKQEIAIRSSGYGKFGDKEIPAEVIGEYGKTADGEHVNAVGMLNLYTASSGDTPQITFIHDPTATIAADKKSEWIEYYDAADVDENFKPKEGAKLKRTNKAFQLVKEFVSEEVE